MKNKENLSELNIVNIVNIFSMQYNFFMQFKMKYTVLRSAESVFPSFFVKRVQRPGAARTLPS